MAGLSNAELTQQLRMMQTNLATFETQLQQILPKMDTAIAQSKSLSDDLRDKITKHVEPLIQLDLKNVLTKMNDDQQIVNKEMEKKLDDLSDLVKRMKIDVDKSGTDQAALYNTVSSEFKSANDKLEHLNKAVTQAQLEILTEKNENAQKYASTQSQLATMQATSSSGAPGGGMRRSNEPLVTHKLFMNKTVLDGTENMEVIDDWYTDMADDFEIVMPGSKIIMQTAEKSDEKCDNTWMMRQNNPSLTCALSRELYSVLKKKTGLKARSQMKTLSENEGLEAWRMIRLNLCRKDGQRLQSEFDTLTTLAKMKVEDFANFTTMKVRWEAELLKFEAIDAEYRLGKFQKKNILYRALPPEIQSDLDKEVSRDETLNQYDKMVSYLQNLSRSQRYQKTTTPKPFSANLVDDHEPTMPKETSIATPEKAAPAEAEIYSVSEWSSYLNTDEGRNFMAQGNPLPIEAQTALYSLIKGKGKGNPWMGNKGKGKGKDSNYFKGKGKGKGKGSHDGSQEKGKGKGKGAPKGGFQGPCHTCNEWGHYARDCPHNQVGALEDAYWQDWTSMPCNSVTLMLTDQPFAGYRNASNFDTEISCVAVIDQQPKATDLPIADASKQQPIAPAPVKAIDANPTTQRSFSNVKYFDPIVLVDMQPTDSRSHDTSDFPSVQVSSKPTSTRAKKPKRMPKIKRMSQKVRFSCDADNMSALKFSKVLNFHANSHGKTTDGAISIGGLSNVGNVEHDQVEQVQENHDNEQTSMESDWNFDMDMCGECEPNSECDDVQMACNCGEENCSENNCNVVDASPEHVPISWNQIHEEYNSIQKARECSEKFHGCSKNCSMGQHCLRTCRAATTCTPAFQDASAHIAMSNQKKMSINMLTMADHGTSAVMNVEDKMVWACIPCAVDSGACAHVAPPNVFGLQDMKMVQHKGKYYGADGSPIDEYGQLTINAILQEGSEMTTTFDVAKITRPLLSVHQIAQNGHQVCFGKNEAHIRLSNGRRIPLRAEGRLYMLDMWIKLPQSLAEKSPFVRQVSQP